MGVMARLYKALREIKDRVLRLGAESKLRKR